MARFPICARGGWLSPTLNSEGGPIISPRWEAHCGRAPVYIDLDAFTPERKGWIRESLRSESPALKKIGLDVFKGGKVQYSSGKTETISNPGGAGGIWPIDKNCASGIPGLYAAGNACGTMGSGALYPNIGFGLTHCAVTANRSALGAANYALKSKRIKLDEEELPKLKKNIFAPLERRGGFTSGWLTQVLHSLTVPYYILQVKHGERLQAALTFVEFLNNHLVPKLMAKDAHELRMAQETKNMALIAEMILRASLFRTESRGNHFREDYPRRDDPTWLAWVKIKNEQGKMKLYKEPIPKKWWPDLSKPYEERYPTMFPGE